MERLTNKFPQNKSHYAKSNKSTASKRRERRHLSEAPCHTWALNSGALKARLLAKSGTFNGEENALVQLGTIDKDYAAEDGVVFVPLDLNSQDALDNLVLQFQAHLWVVTVADNFNECLRTI